MTQQRCETSYTISYNSESHWSVLTQMKGSIWLKVFPWCVLNVAIMVTLIVVERHFVKGRYKLAMTGDALKFVSMVVAFLLVSRVNIALNRYGVARNCLEQMYRECRELVQNCCVFTAENQTPAAAEWRNEVTYRTCIMLRTAMEVIDYPETGAASWDIPELTGKELELVKAAVHDDNATKRYALKERSAWEETMRVPNMLAFLLRQSIQNHGAAIKDPPLAEPMQNKLLGSVDSFNVGYYGIRRFLTTPVPFPLIQMSRTFLFLYVFSVPFVLLADSSSDVAHCFAVFLLTYGFVGLELVAIEMDNPFGEDDNDFDNLAMAVVAFEDTYLTIMDVDGEEWAKKLRHRMHGNPDQPLVWNTTATGSSTEQTPLLNTKV